jgi:hypothetical protein
MLKYVIMTQELLAPENNPFPAGEGVTPGGEGTISDDPVVLANLEMLNSDGFGEMVSSESIGGNAGAAEINGVKVPCVGINGYADRQSGSITTFGNPQEVDPAIVTRDSNFILRVALPELRAMLAGLPTAMKIIGVIGGAGMDETAKAKLEAAIHAWNASQAAQAEPRN